MPRFTIGRIMLAVVVAAILAAVYRSVNRLAFMSLLIYFGFIGLVAVQVWSRFRGGRRFSRRVFLVATLVGCPILAGLDLLSIGSAPLVFKLMILLGCLPFAAGAGVAWAQVATGPDASPRRSRATAWGLVIGVLLLPVLLTFTDWPTRAAFVASRPALDRLADRVEAGGGIDRPEWAGAFRVRKVSTLDVGPGHVSLILDSDPSGHSRLIRAPRPDAVPTPPQAPQRLHRIGTDGRWWYHETE